MPDPTSSKLFSVHLCLRIRAFFFFFFPSLTHPFMHSSVLSSFLLLHRTGAGILCTSSTVCLLWLLLTCLQIISLSSHTSLHFSLQSHLGAVNTVQAGQLRPSHSWRVFLCFCSWEGFQNNEPLIPSQTEKCEAGVGRRGRLWGRGLLLCCHCLRRAAAAAAQGDPLCVSVCRNTLHTVITGTETRSCAAFTIRLRWHLNNELSLSASLRPTLPVEAPSSCPATVTRIQY